MKRKIKLTESELYGLVKNTVSRIILEGQGYQKFKQALKAPASTKMPTWKEADEFITTGGADVNQPWGNYYDKNGDRTDRVQNSQGKIGQGFKHKLGRAASVIGGAGVLGAKKAANALRKGVGSLYDKWQHRKLKRKESGGLDYESKSRNLDKIISEAISKVVNEGYYDDKTPEEFYNEFRNLKKNPCFEFEDGVIYVDYDPEKNKFIAGSVTNAGLIPEYEFDVDLSMSLDQNLEGLYEYLIENGEKEIDW